jgi:hypothetical protein
VALDADGVALDADAVLAGFRWLQGVFNALLLMHKGALSQTAVEAWLHAPSPLS